MRRSGDGGGKDTVQTQCWNARSRGGQTRSLSGLGLGQAGSTGTPKKKYTERERERERKLSHVTDAELQ